MPEVPVRELNQNTAGVLARVKRGEEIAITERGAVIAIHSATARAVFGGRLSAFVTYDRRLRGCAEALGLPVRSPAG